VKPCKKCWCLDVRIANIWKVQTHMKIANPCGNFKRPHRNNTPKCENYKLIWKLQTDIKIANWYENCKEILTFWGIVPTWTFAIFIEDIVGLKTCSEKKIIGWIVVLLGCTHQCRNSLISLTDIPMYIRVVFYLPWLSARKLESLTRILAIQH